MLRSGMRELWYALRDLYYPQCNPSAKQFFLSSKEELLDEHGLIEFEIVTLEPPEQVTTECWEWRHVGRWSELAPTKEQAIIDQREYAMEMIE